MDNPKGVSPSKGNHGTTRGKEKNLFDLGGNQTHDLWTRSTITPPTELRDRRESRGRFKVVNRGEEKAKVHMTLCRVSLSLFRPDFLKKRERAGGVFCYLFFPIACFFGTLLPSPRDTLELLGQILIKRNIRN